MQQLLQNLKQFEWKLQTASIEVVTAPAEAVEAPAGWHMS